MLKRLAWILYTGLAAFANPAAALDLAPLLTGDMAKLVAHSAPKPLPEVTFQTADGTSALLSDYQGKWVLLNLWATWCAPCRAEMPMLSALQTTYGGETFEVITIATGRDSPAKVARFMDSIAVTNLPRHTDPNQKLARSLGILGLPVVLLIAPDGSEVARLTGPAKWDAPEALALVDALARDTTQN